MFVAFACTLVHWVFGYVRVFVGCLRIVVLVGWKDSARTCNQHVSNYSTIYNHKKKKTPTQMMLQMTKNNDTYTN